MEWFAKESDVDIDFTALKRSIAASAIEEFLKDVSFWFVNDGIDISSSGTGARIVVVPWDQILAMGHRVIIKKRIDDILENERLEEDEDEIEHSDGEVDHACF